MPRCWGTYYEWLPRRVPTQLGYGYKEYPLMGDSASGDWVAECPALNALPPKLLAAQSVRVLYAIYKVLQALRNDDIKNARTV